MSDLQSLKQELDQLKKRVAYIERSTGLSYSSSDLSASGGKTPPKPSEPSLVAQFFHWLREDWLMKLGAFLLILALAWFVRFAFLNNWVGPLGRVSLGLLAGAGIMAFGHLQIEKRRVPGQVLMITGEVMMLLTLYASLFYYEMFSGVVTLGMMVVVVIATAVLSVLHESKSMAVTALLGGAFAPLLANTGTNDYVNLLRYIFILDLGVLAVVSRTGWRFLTLLGLIMTALYSFFFYDVEYFFGQQQVWILMAMFFGLFFLANLFTLVKSQKAAVTDVIIAGGNGALLLIWIANYVPEESASLVLSGVTLLMVGASALLLKKEIRAPLFVYSALGLVFMGAATAFELDGSALTIAFSLEALAAVALSSYVLGSPKATRLVSIVQSIPVLMSLQHLDSWYWRDSAGLLNEHFFVLLVATFSLAATAVLLMQLKDDENFPWARIIQTVFASLFGISLLWLSLHQVIEDANIARGVALVVYTLVGVGLMYFGTKMLKTSLRIGGGLLLGGVVLRLLFVEVWEMPLTGRIVTFVAIGVLLISTAFFEKKLH